MGITSKSSAYEVPEEKLLRRALKLRKSKFGMRGVFFFSIYYKGKKYPMF